MNIIIGDTHGNNKRDIRGIRHPHNKYERGSIVLGLGS